MTAAGRAALTSVIRARVRELDLPNLAAFERYAGLNAGTLRNLLTHGPDLAAALRGPALAALAAALARPEHDLQYLLAPQLPLPADCPFAAPLYCPDGPERTPLPGQFVPLERHFVRGRDLVAFLLPGTLLIVDRQQAPATGQLLAVTVRDVGGYLIRQLRATGEFAPPPPPLTSGGHMRPVRPADVTAITGTVVGTPDSLSVAGRSCTPAGSPEPAA